LEKSDNQLYNRWFFTDSFHELSWFFEVLEITKNLWFFDSDFPFFKEWSWQFPDSEMIQH